MTTSHDSLDSLYRDPLDIREACIVGNRESASSWNVFLLNICTDSQ